MIVTHTEQAGKYRAEAGHHYYAARRDARRAADAYRTAQSVEQHAAWLTRRQDVAQPGYTPADLATEARTWVSIADAFLRSSFRATDNARFCNDLAKRYDAIAERTAPA